MGVSHVSRFTSEGHEGAICSAGSPKLWHNSRSHMPQVAGKTRRQKA